MDSVQRTRLCLACVPAGRGSPGPVMLRAGDEVRAAGPIRTEREVQILPELAPLKLK